MGDDAPLTILFTDVEGSTDLRTRRGDAAAHEIQMLLERSGDGDREQAEKVLNQAIDDYERMGMPRHRDLTSTLLGSL